MEDTVSITEQVLGRKPNMNLVAQPQETGLEAQAQETVSHARTARLTGFSGRSHSAISLDAHGGSARDAVKRGLEMIGITR